MFQVRMKMVGSKSRKSPFIRKRNSLVFLYSLNLLPFQDKDP
jgi:hypothetical protein